MNATTAMKKIMAGLPFADARERVVTVLEAHGFGVVTEIDLRATFAKKLGIDFGPYSILGACNPTIAHQALETEPDVGLLLPCNVVVRQVPAGAEVSFVDPLAMASMFPEVSLLEPLMQDAHRRLAAAFADL